MPHLEVKLGALEAHERREHRRDPGRASGKQHQPSDEIVRDNHLPEQAQGRLGFKRPAPPKRMANKSGRLTSISVLPTIWTMGMLSMSYISAAATTTTTAADRGVTCSARIRLLRTHENA